MFTDEFRISSNHLSFCSLLSFFFYRSWALFFSMFQPGMQIGVFCPRNFEEAVPLGNQNPPVLSLEKRIGMNYWKKSIARKICCPRNIRLVPQLRYWFQLCVRQIIPYKYTYHIHQFYICVFQISIYDFLWFS